MAFVRAILFFVVLLGSCGHPARRFAEGYCSIGTGELNAAFAHWSHDWQKQGHKPWIHEGRGSTVAPDALLKEICDVGPMSRPMNAPEIDRFIKKYNDRPRGIPVAIEALALIVRTQNPLTRLSWKEMQSLLGNTPKTWGEIFAQIPRDWKSRELRVCGINSATERYAWLRRSILHGSYGDRILERPTPAAIREDLLAGKCDLAYLRPLEIAGERDLRPLALGLPEGGGFVFPEPAHIQSGRYPLSRYYYVYLPPKKRPLPMRQETLAFVKYVLSPKGQAVLAPLGLYSVQKSD